MAAIGVVAAIANAIALAKIIEAAAMRTARVTPFDNLRSPLTKIILFPRPPSLHAARRRSARSFCAEAGSARLI